MLSKNAYIVAAIIAVSIVVFFCLYSFYNKKSISSVVTNDDNTVSLLAQNSGDYSAAGGYITVDDEKKLRLDYSMNKGSFDISINTGESDINAVGDGTQLKEDVKLEDLTGDVITEKKDISGSGQIDFEVEKGEYMVFITYHNADGEGKLYTVDK